MRDRQRDNKRGEEHRTIHDKRLLSIMYVITLFTVARAGLSLQANKHFLCTLPRPLSLDLHRQASFLKSVSYLSNFLLERGLV